MAKQSTNLLQEKEPGVSFMLAALLFVSIFMLQMVFLPTLSEVGSYKVKASIFLDGLYAARVGVMCFRRERNSTLVWYSILLLGASIVIFIL